MRPRSARWGSGTRAGVLGRHAVEVVAKPSEIDPRRSSEHGDGGFRPHEPVSTQRGQFSDRYAVPGDHECLAPVQPPHDLAAVVSKLPLGDVSSHGF